MILPTALLAYHVSKKEFTEQKTKVSKKYQDDFDVILSTLYF